MSGDALHSRIRRSPAARRTAGLKRAVARPAAAFSPLIVAGLLAGSADRAAVAQEGGAPERPNVVVVMTDDQDVRSVRKMRAVRRQLAGNGTTFNNFFATFPLCCPSRATFLSGQYSHNHGVRGNDNADDGGYKNFDDAGTLAPSLSSAGYRTGYVGKYLNGYGNGDSNRREIPRGWSDWHVAVEGGMFDYKLNDNGRVRHYGTRQRHYQTDIYADKAVRFLDQSADSPDPFFLTVATQAPHDEGLDPPRPAPRHRGAFDGASLPKPRSFNEGNVSDKPSFVRRRPRLDRRARRGLTQLYRGRLESLLAVDEAVARIVKKLRGEGELANTLIVFTSDNGYMLGEHRLKKKTWLYEESAGVPLIVRGPGIPEGVTREQVTGNIDLAPTILDFTGVEPGVRMDGVPLLPLAQDESEDAGRDILLENDTSIAVRTPRFMYARHRGGEKELYDLRSDALQLESRHRSEAYNDEQRALAERLSTLKDCAGVECR